MNKLLWALLLLPAATLAKHRPKARSCTTLPAYSTIKSCSTASSFCQDFLHKTITPVTTTSTTTTTRTIPRTSTVTVLVPTSSTTTTFISTSTAPTSTKVVTTYSPCSSSGPSSSPGSPTFIKRMEPDGAGRVERRDPTTSCGVGTLPTHAVSKGCKCFLTTPTQTATVTRTTATPSYTTVTKKQKGVTTISVSTITTVTPTYTTTTTVCGTPPACSGQLVTNPGFETGDFTGWSLYIDPGNSASVASGQGSSGNYGAIAAAVRQKGPYSRVTLSQDLGTCDGTVYDVSMTYKFANLASDTYINVFAAGAYVISVRAAGQPPVGQFHTATGYFTATSASTHFDVGIIGTNYNTDNFFLDDITVTARQ